MYITKINSIKNIPEDAAQKHLRGLVTTVAEITQSRADNLQTRANTSQRQLK